MRILHSLAVVFVCAWLSTTSQVCFAQKPCEQLTPADLEAVGVPSVTKPDVGSCHFLTVAKWRRQTEPGELAIVPVKDATGSPEAFARLQSEWHTQHGGRCGLELGVGRNAAWCNTGSVDSLDYELLIVRGNTISAIILHNWIQPPNPARTMALSLAKAIFGGTEEEAPLARPKD